MNKGDARLIFNGQSRLLKFFMYGEGTPRHLWTMHDVGVNDQYITGGEDVYGYRCKMPPGANYTLGIPQACGPDSADGRAYGWWFIPINDNPQHTLAQHNRAGLGLHGGGSDLAEPFAPFQGWEWTFGCGRLQNAAIGLETPAPGTLTYSVQWIQKTGHLCYFDVVWP